MTTLPRAQVEDEIVANIARAKVNKTTGLRQRDVAERAVNRVKQAELATQRAKDKHINALRKALRNPNFVDAKIKYIFDHTGREEGTWWITDTHYYSGILVDGYPEGSLSVFKYGRPSTLFIQGNYENNKKNGVFTVFHKHRMEQTVYQDDVKVGTFKVTYSNGDVFLRSFVNGSFTADDVGTFIARDGTKYKGRKSYLSRCLMRPCVSCWKATAGELVKPESCINLIGLLILTGVSTVVTVTSLAALPVTTTIDGIHRSLRRI